MLWTMTCIPLRASVPGYVYVYLPSATRLFLKKKKKSIKTVDGVTRVQALGR